VPDIFDEVEQELRSDRAKAVLVRYGGLMVGAAVLVVVAVGGWEAWRFYDTRHAESVASLYLDASRTADATKGPARQEAAAQFAEVTARGRTGYATLATLRAAGLKADAGDLAGASALWDQVAGDANADPLLRDLANLQWAQHHVGAAPPAAIQARLAGLQAPTNPWHPLADETQAMLDLHQGKTAAAKSALKALASDPTVPQGIQRRAGGLLASLGG
jgi:hypothetical protein